jgi:plasmid stabilization system protein ParE
MNLKWTGKAHADLVRLHEFLEPVNPEAAARVVQSLAGAAENLAKRPRVGERLDQTAACGTWPV